MENIELNRIINENIDEFTHVLDIGCGTGLCYKLLNKENNKNYLGIDNQSSMIRWCKNKYNNIFYLVKAEEYIININRLDTCISLFSLNYMNTKIIKNIYKKMDNKFIAVHYNKPYLCKNSAYYKQKLYFYLVHGIKKLRIKYIFWRLGAKTYKLLNKDYYYVTILEKNLNLKKLELNEILPVNFPVYKRIKK